MTALPPWWPATLLLPPLLYTAYQSQKRHVVRAMLWLQTKVQMEAIIGLCHAQSVNMLYSNRLQSNSCHCFQVLLFSAGHAQHLLPDTRALLIS
jgi:hypothetical protein